jgi:hypothetical protein
MTRRDAQTLTATTNSSGTDSGPQGAPTTGGAPSPVRSAGGCCDQPCDCDPQDCPPGCPCC